MAAAPPARQDSPPLPGLGTVPALLLTDMDDRVQFAFGFADETIPTAFPSPPDMGWHFNPHNQTLYRYYVLHMWLGMGGMGHLVLFQPVDHALLSQMATLKTNVFLRWHNRTIASSLGDHASQIRLLPGAGQLSYEYTTYMQDSLLWDEAHPDSPELVVHQEIDSLFDYWEVALGITVTLAGLFAALWASIGIWVYRTTQRITLVGEASHQFAEDGYITVDIKALLEVGVP